MDDLPASAIAHAFRKEYGRAVAVLTRVLGDIDLAEDAVQDAFAIATVRWPVSGVPPSVAGWIINTAKNKAIDHLRREASRADKHAEAMARLSDDTPETEDEGIVHDDQLRMIFTCCHPSMAMSAQVALTLRLVAGLTTEEIARAFFVPEATMAQRLLRAKGKIRDAKIPYRVPSEADLASRVQAVLSVVYLIFNEGHTASSGDRLSREDLGSEAIRLGRLLVELLPNDPEVRGLLALMLLVESRRLSRTTSSGDLVLLKDQDRASWQRDLLDEGQAIIRALLTRNEPGPYQIQAAINAVHSDAKTAEATDWPQIVALYDQLTHFTPTPIVALHRAVAVAEVKGPQAGLELVDVLGLTDYYLFHAVRADLLRRLDRKHEAALAYAAAIERSENVAERAFLQRRLDALADA
ncbi:MAG: RNA polymerase sigma factor [Polyangiaceae bacterium]